MQTKAQSMLEAWMNIAIGFGINFSANLVVLPAVGLAGVTSSRAFEIGLIFTVISLARSYLLRRLFNRLHG